jgi:hypothetical protein
MRHVLITAAAFAACGFLASTTANAQMPYEPGGPARVGNMCKVFAGTNYWPQQETYGYYAPCAVGAYAEAPAAHQQRQHSR